MSMGKVYNLNCYLSSCNQWRGLLPKDTCGEVAVGEWNREISCYQLGWWSQLPTGERFRSWVYSVKSESRDFSSCGFTIMSNSGAIGGNMERWITRINKVTISALIDFWVQCSRFELRWREAFHCTVQACFSIVANTANKCVEKRPPKKKIQLTKSQET